MMNSKLSGIIDSCWILTWAYVITSWIFFGGIDASVIAVLMTPIWGGFVLTAIDKVVSAKHKNPQIMLKNENKPKEINS